jgi:hypothetical protein
MDFGSFDYNCNQKHFETIATIVFKQRTPLQLVENI